MMITANYMAEFVIQAKLFCALIGVIRHFRLCAKQILNDFESHSGQIALAV